MAAYHAHSTDFCERYFCFSPGTIRLCWPKHASVGLEHRPTDSHCTELSFWSDLWIQVSRILWLRLGWFTNMHSHDAVRPISLQSSAYTFHRARSLQLHLMEIGASWNRYYSGRYMPVHLRPINSSLHYFIDFQVQAHGWSLWSFISKWIELHDSNE